VIGNFNNWKKFDPESLGVWARVASQVPHSLLWLMKTLPYDGPRDSIASLLRHYAVSEERMVVTEMLPHETHLVHKRQADVFLDTLTYNAHSTAVELLWSGVAVVSVAGRSMAGRVAASVLLAHTAEVTLARNAMDMEHLALRLLTSPHTLKRVKLHLERKREMKGLLFDYPAWTRSYEAALLCLWDAGTAGRVEPLGVGAVGQAGKGGRATGMHIVVASSA